MDSKQQDIRKNYSSIKKDTREIKSATAAQMAPGYGLIKRYPQDLAVLKKAGLKEEEVKLKAVVTTLARDLDTFGGQFKELDERASPLLATDVRKKAHMARDYTKLLSLGVQYSELGTRAAGSVANALTNYEKIIDELPGDEVND